MRRNMIYILYKYLISNFLRKITEINICTQKILLRSPLKHDTCKGLKDFWAWECFSELSHIHKRININELSKIETLLHSWNKFHLVLMRFPQ